MNKQLIPSKFRSIILALFALGSAAWVALYFTEGQNVQNFSGNCEGSLAAANKLDKLSVGEVAALRLTEKERAMPNMEFLDNQSNTRSLKEWSGRTVLLNIWATWCLPCKEEMPYLSSLNAKLGGDDFAVVAVNIDNDDGTKARRFFEELAIRDLEIFLDKKAASLQALKTVGMGRGLPTSVLIGNDGCEIGRMEGPAVWDSDEAVALIEAAIENQ